MSLLEHEESGVKRRAKHYSLYRFNGSKFHSSCEKLNF